MQERFCICGHKVMVDYKQIISNWKSMFFSEKKSQSIQRCPHCGNVLNINTLR